MKAKDPIVSYTYTAPIHIRPWMVDFMQVVNNVWYAKIFEGMLTDLLDTTPLTLPQLLARGEAPIVSGSEIKYYHPLHLSSKPVGVVTLSFYPPFRWLAVMEISEGDRRVCWAVRQGTYVSLSEAGSYRPRPIPKEYYS